MATKKILEDDTLENFGYKRIAIPGKKCQEYVQHPDGKIERRCYGAHNPHYYMDSAGDMHPIELNDKKSGLSSKKEPIELQSCNVVSVGKKTNGNKKKYLGLRPDFCQDTGIEQLEFDIESVVFNGHQSDISIDDIQIFSTRQRCRQLIPADDSVKSFEIKFTLHLTGLKVEYKAELDEYWIYSKQGDFRFRIRKPVIVDSDYNIITADFETAAPNPSEFISHSLTKNEDGTYTYIKESKPGFEKLNLPNSYYIDADTYYTESSDGYCNYQNAVSWNDVHGASDSGGANDTDAYLNRSHGGSYFVGPLWQICRSFYSFDLSGVAVVASASLFIEGYLRAESSVAAQQGEQNASLVGDDYDAFSGNEYGHVAWIVGTNEIVLNAVGITALNNEAGGIAKICCREYEHDYLNSEPSARYHNGAYYSEDAGTTDPYLSIVEVETPTLTSPTSIQIQDTQAILGANLTDDGGGTITERGIVWALTDNPTTANNKVIEGGTGTGVFTDTITGLPVHTTIYFRGYAINERGTGYSDSAFFATSRSLTEGYPAYIVTNLLDNLNFSADVTSSTENAYYPLENLNNKDMANPFRFTSEANGYIEFNFGAAVSFNFIGLLNHSFSNTATVTVKAGSSSNPSTVVMTLTHQNQDMFKYTLYSTSAQYVRVAWTDAGGAAVHGIGELILGSLIILTSQFTIGFTEKLNEGKIKKQTHKGVQETFNLYSLESREYSFTNLSSTQKNELQTLHQTADGSQYPFIWIPDIGETELLYVKKSDEFRRQNISDSRYNGVLSLKEQSRGVEVTA